MAAAGQVYLRTNGTVGLLFKEPASAAPPVVVAPPLADWEYRPSIYFIRNYSNAPGDGIPALCKKVLTGVGPSMTSECIAAGIEDLQIEYGIDLNDDGNPNVFLPITYALARCTNGESRAADDWRRLRI